MAGAQKCMSSSRLGPLDSADLREGLEEAVAGAGIWGCALAHSCAPLSGDEGERRTDVQYFRHTRRPAQGALWGFPDAGLAMSSVLTYLAEAAEALTFLHTQDVPVIHGDVKPANLILTRGGRVKLVDFGLSSTPGMGSQRSSTAGFQAPELHGGAPPSRASDVFALAATAYALLAGAPPGGAPPPWEGLGGQEAERLQAVIEA